MIVMKYYISLLTFLFFTLVASAQDSRLATQYYNSGEYEKAAAVYLKMYQKQPNSYYYFSQYVKSLIAQEDYPAAENAIKKEIKKNPQNVELYVTFGNLYERQSMPEKAEAQYRHAIDNMPADVAVINKLGNEFLRNTKYDLAIEAYLKSQDVLNDKNIFANNLADLYKRIGDIPKMIQYYIAAAEKNTQQIDYFKTIFQRNVNTDEGKEELRSQLYAKIQENDSNLVYPELLEWVYIERADYYSALKQARAMDRKHDENGSRVMNIGNIAYNSKDYDTAISAYEYIIEKKGASNGYFLDAKGAILKTHVKEVTESYDYTAGQLDTLDNEYSTFIEEMGINPKTELIVKQYAEFLALYKNDLGKAISVLENLVGISSVNKYVRANGKISMADYYLMQGEIWEATLLYSQVEKAFKEEYLGEVSRFKNAQLAYYAGDFEWSQEQFKILRTATTRLISNDAIDMSIFIMDNMGLDTTDVPLQMFAESELLTLQNKHDEAFAKLDSISILFPKHALEDDILYQKANLHLTLKDYEKAKELYTTIYSEYKEEIRADNALFKLASLYENQLENPEEAMLLYEKLFIDFSNSTFAIEARKKFRTLRGDNVQ